MISSTNPPTIEQPCIKVAVPVGLRKLFDYSANHIAKLRPGMRVLVPFGSRKLVGLIIEIGTTTRTKLKPIDACLDSVPTLGPNLLHLLRWASSYYLCPIGTITHAALPSRLRTAKPAPAPPSGFKLAPHLTTTDWVRLKSDKQQRICQQLAAAPAGLLETELKAAGADTRSLRALEKKGWLVLADPTCMPNEQTLAPQPYPLTQEQTTTVTAIQARLAKFSITLLEGVTGSGKTEVYCQLIQQVLAAGKQALILVPEINLTPQTQQRFEARFAATVRVMHSKVSALQRYRTWEAAKTGTARIILGTRMALFTPLQNPGLFIIDEEHDTAFKQQDTFRYSARDCLIKRAQIENCPIVLGTATPSLESWLNAKRGRFAYNRLTQRTNRTLPPSIEIIDIQHRRLKSGLSYALLDKIDRHLQAGHQALIFINRRGFSPLLMCHDCGWYSRCQRCDGALVYHAQPARLRCHHCDYNAPLPVSCPECQGQNLAPLGAGTQRIESALAEHFPAATLARVDGDSMQHKGKLEEVLEQIANRQANLIVATQMLAKGHDFPNLTLVAIIAIDNALFSADFRATERLGQMVIQMAGRAGRACQTGEVCIQTTQPQHPIIQTLCSGDYNQFLQILHAEREQACLPPFCFQILIRAESRHPQRAQRLLQQLKQQFPTHAAQMLGPTGALMEKKQGYYRAQLLLQDTLRAPLNQLARALVSWLEQSKLANGVRWSVDVDPLEF